jgi:flagellar motor protein MotB
MKKLAALPVIALAALAVAPGCSSRRARTAAVAPPVVQAPMAQAPVYTMPAPGPDVATKSDLQNVEQKLDSIAQTVNEMRSQPPAPPAPAPMPVYAPPPVAVAEPTPPASDSEAARFIETLRSRGVEGVEQNGSTVTIRLTDAFRPGSDNLKGDVELAKTLQAVSEGLQLSPGARVQVVGHTDLTPIDKSRKKWADNSALSRARAQTVARVLSESGVRSHIDVDGRGESEPLISPEKDKADQSRNRRVEVQVSF